MLSGNEPRTRRCKEMGMDKEEEEEAFSDAVSDQDRVTSSDWMLMSAEVETILSHVAHADIFTVAY